MQKGKKRILIVEDEEDICAIIKYNLEKQEIEVDTTQSAEQALELDLNNYDLFIFDIMMGKLSGIDLAKYVKNDNKLKNTPFIFLTAKTQTDDIVEGLELGADDYIPKPFVIKELVARVKAILRRHNKDKSLCYKDLKIDIENKIASCKGKELPLTKLEFGILTLLLKNKNRTYSREEILELVWSKDIVVSLRTVDVTITRLRKKIGAFSNNIVSKNGFGYRFFTEKE